MVGVGVVEGFFGPEWSWESRLKICQSLQSYSGDFYIYAPKRDPYLRKSWAQSHPNENWKQLKNLSQNCAQSQIRFGVGLSPFEIHANWNNSTKQALREKVEKLEELEIRYLGLFFDDMKGSPDLAEKQSEIVNFVKNITQHQIWFCPTYYSLDPILDKVFGQRPESYLEKIGQNISSDVSILWTGSKVISKVISDQELHEVAAILKRKPLLWDNYYANDGPRQCRFLSLKSFEGRSAESFSASSGWALNLMNQAHLSEILMVAAIDVLKKRKDPTMALSDRLLELGGETLRETVQRYQAEFLEKGLDKMDESVKSCFQQTLRSQNIYEKDILDWLQGDYIVGPECLTD